MTIAKIVVPLTGGARDATSLESAFRIAHLFRSHVAALFVRVAPAYSMSFVGLPLAPQVMADLLQAAEEASKTAGLAARAALAEAANRAEAKLVDTPERGEGVTCSFREVRGIYSGCVAQASRLADLVVFGHLTASDGPDFGDAFVETLLGIDRPVLITPHALSRPPKKICVAWDGSRTAVHAVATAIPFLRRAESSEILEIRRTPPMPTDERELLEYLSLQGIDATRRIVHPIMQDPAETLMTAAIDNGADLLVMGGYGHSHWGEAFLGGVTQHIRWHARLPVLMVH